MKKIILLLCIIISIQIFGQQVESTRIVKSGLSFPWEILWGKDNSLWMTERGGKISKINPANGATEFSYSIPEVYSYGEGGLLGMVQHPSFLTNGYLYVVYTYNKNTVYTEKVVRFTYANNALSNPLTLIDNIAGGNYHNGSRLLILGDKLFITTGEAGVTSLSQQDNSPNGKVLRINLDGSIPSDNPIAGNPMWTKGMRNPQGFVYANGLLYTAEHGPHVDDEINIIEKGRNYGWPGSYGPCVGNFVPFCTANNVKVPIMSSGGVTIAMSGLDYYNSDHLPDWKNSLLLATLKDATFYQVKLSTNGLTVVSQKEYFRGNWGRLRDIAISPSGKVYICTSNGGGNDRIIEVSNSSAPPNQSPVANAGGNQTITLPTNSVSLTGSGTDPDGTITAYNWTKISGPAQGTIANPNLAATAVNGLVQGIYQFRLQVTDNAGATATATVTITVNAAPPPNQSPVANAGTNQTITLPTNSVTLTGSGTDADGTITGYSWTKIGGPAQGTIASANSASTAVNGLVQGVYQFRLQVTDDDGATGTATVTVNVAPPPNQPPVANAGNNQAITLPINSVTLTGSGTDADGTISGYSWTKISGPAQGTITSPNSVATTVNGLVQGVYQFRLQVTDDDGATAAATVTITVNAAPPPNQSPVANAGTNQTITLPTNNVILTGSGTDADGTITDYSWTKISGPAQGAIANPNNASTDVDGLVQGVYQFQLQVTDNGGATDNATLTVTVNAAPPNQLPVANAGADQTITLPLNSVTLTGSGTDPDGTITTYSWTKLGGPSGATITSPGLASTDVTNLFVGSYIFRLTITDNDGATATDDVQVTVDAAPVETTRELKTGLNYPWEILWGKDNSIWMTERGGKLSKVNPATGATDFSYNISDVVASGDGGLLGMVQHPNFLTNGYLYVVYNYSKNGNYTQKVVRLTYAGSTLNSPTNLLDDIPAANANNGSRLVILGDKLFITTGDATNSVLAQDNLSRSGKVLRINLDGSIPADNPIAGSPLWSSGNRNAQGLVFANNMLYSSEHGASIEDEINIIEKNRNYGWPNVEGPCDGAEQTFCNTNNIKQPLWSTGGLTTAVSGLDYYNSSHFPDWTNSLLLATLKDATFYQLKLSADGLSVVSIKEYFRGNWGRLRDIAVSPDGKIYICTSNGGGNDRIIEISNRNAPPNQLPLAFAGADQTITLPTNSVTLTGSGTDADGSISGYSWTKISGPAQDTIASANSAGTPVDGLVQGVYEFRLEVTDNAGAKDADTLKITVNAAPPPPPPPAPPPPANQPPVANAGGDVTITLPTNSVTLTGSGSDADGTISGYSWIRVSGPAQGTIASANTSVTAVDGLVQGLYEFRLEVTDNAGTKDADTVKVTVNAALPAPPAPEPNLVPVIVMEDTIVVTLPVQSAALDGSGSYDPDGSIDTYAWVLIDGPSIPRLLSPTNASTVVTDLRPGVYIFELTIFDNKGALSKARVAVHVKNSNSRRHIPKIRLYPNPATKIVNVSIETEAIGRTSITLYDVRGVAVLKEEFVKNTTSLIKALIVRGLHKGTYIMEIKVDVLEKVIQKLIKL